MADLPGLAREVLRDSYLADLGVCDAEGPWVAAVTFVHDEKDLSIYWLSQPHARHSLCIEKDGTVAAAITAAWESGKERALQLEGHAERIPEAPAEIVESYALKRGREKLAQMLRTLERGTVWYRLTPKRIELIYNSFFGYDRQRVL